MEGGGVKVPPQIDLLPGAHKPLGSYWNASVAFLELAWLHNAAEMFFLSLSGTSWQQPEPGKSVENFLVF